MSSEAKCTIDCPIIHEEIAETLNRLYDEAAADIPHRDWERLELTANWCSREKKLESENINYAGIPSFGVHIGRREIASGKMTSFFVIDKERDEKDWILTALLNAPCSTKLRRLTRPISVNGGKFMAVEDIYILYRNPRALCTLPTCETPTIAACNVERTFTTELRLQAEDGWNCCVYLNTKTGGMGAVSFFNVVGDMLDACTVWDELAKMVPGASFDSVNGILRLPFFNELGECIFMEFENRRDLLEMVTSVRLVSNSETTINKE